MHSPVCCRKFLEPSDFCTLWVAQHRPIPLVVLLQWRALVEGWRILFSLCSTSSWLPMVKYRIYLVKLRIFLRGYGLAYNLECPPPSFSWCNVVTAWFQPFASTTSSNHEYNKIKYSTSPLPSYWGAFKFCSGFTRLLMKVTLSKTSVSRPFILSMLLALIRVVIPLSWMYVTVDTLMQWFHCKSFGSYKLTFASQCTADPS